MKFISLFNALLYFVLTQVSLLSCVYSADSEVNLNSTPSEDKEYSDKFEKYSRRINVFNNFEMRYKITATYLSPEFQEAFKKRYEEIFREPQTIWDETGAKAGFFVTVFSPENEAIDLTDAALWTILLKTDKESLKPTLVKKLDKKERWRPFFEDVNPWSKEYLIVFDHPTINPNAADLVNKIPVNLLFANADAQVSLAW